MPGFVPDGHTFIHGKSDKDVEGRNKSGPDPGQGMPSFMDLALDQARKAQAAGEVPVGCVIVRDSTMISSAGNRTLTDRDPTAHAEVVAIRAAANELGSERLADCDLYVTLEPCAM